MAGFVPASYVLLVVSAVAKLVDGQPSPIRKREGQSRTYRTPRSGARRNALQACRLSSHRYEPHSKGLSGSGKPPHALPNRGSVVPFGNLKLVMRLEIEPERPGYAEGSLKSERGVSRDAAPSAHDVADAVLWNAKCLRQAVGTEFVRLHEILTEGHARVDGSDHR